MKHFVALLILLTVTACTAPPLTGDDAADCLAARNFANQMQSGVSNAQKALTALVILTDPPEDQVLKARELLDLARADLDDAIAQRDILCAPPVVIIPAVTL